MKRTILTEIEKSKGVFQQKEMIPEKNTEIYGGMKTLGRVNICLILIKYEILLTQRLKILLDLNYSRNRKI